MALSDFGAARKPGANGRSAIVFAHLPPPGAEVRVKPPSWGPPSGVPDHAVIAWVAAFGPQVGGLVSRPLASSKSSFTDVNGSCGFSLKTVVSCPVAGSALTLPISRTSTP